MSKNTNLSFLTDFLTADIVNSRVGMNNVSPQSTFDVTGTGKFSGILTLGSTVSNGTYTYTLPSATGTLALTSDIPSVSGYVPYTGATGNVNLGTYILSALNLIANGNTNSGALLLKNANAASLIDTGYFKFSPSSSNTEISFGFSTGASTWKQFSFSSHLITNNTITIFSLPNGGGTLAVTTDLGAYLPLTGGTLTGALNGTSATFSGDLIAASATLNTPAAGISMLLTGRSSDSLNQIRFNSNVGALNNFITSLPASLIIASQGSTPIEFITNNAVSSTPRMSISGAGAVTLTGALNGTSASFSGTINSTITNNLVLSNNSSTTQYVYTSLANSVGNARYGVDNSTGGGLGTGTSPNSAVFGNAGNADVDITTNNISRLKIASTGAATFSSSVSGTSIRSSAVGSFGFNTANNGEFQIYATAANGMIMAGRGSSTDMVITNKNGADVFTIPTGTTNILIGAIGGGTATASPVNLSLGSTFSNTGGSNLKLTLFNDTGGNIYGLGVSNNRMDFNVPSGAAYSFYTGNVLIGTTTDSGRKLNVNGSGLFSGTLSTAKIEVGAVNSVNITTGSTFTLIPSSNFNIRTNILVSVAIKWDSNANAQRQYLLFIGATDTAWGTPNSAISVIASNDWSSGYVGAASFSIGGSGSLRTLNISVSGAATYNVTAYAAIVDM